MLFGCRIYVSDDDISYWEDNSVEPALSIDSMRDLVRIFINGLYAGRFYISIVYQCSIPYFSDGCSLSNRLVCSCTCMVLDPQLIYEHLVVKGYRCSKSTPEIMWYSSGKELREKIMIYLSYLNFDRITMRT